MKPKLFGDGSIRSAAQQRSSGSVHLARILASGKNAGKNVPENRSGCPKNGLPIGSNPHGSIISKLAHRNDLRIPRKSKADNSADNSIDSGCRHGCAIRE